MTTFDDSALKRTGAALVCVAAMWAAAGGALAQTSPQAAPPVVVQPAAGPTVVQSLPPSRWTAQQVRQAFELADSDSDGSLTRAEAQHLTIMPRSFEDMDVNKDGVLSRAEYEGSIAR